MDPDNPVELARHLSEMDAATLQDWYAQQGIDVHLVPSKYAGAFHSIYTHNVGRDVLVRHADYEQACLLLPEFQHEMQAHRAYWALQAQAPPDPEDVQAYNQRRSVTRTIRRIPWGALHTGAGVTLVLLVVQPVHWILGLTLGIGLTLLLTRITHQPTDQQTQSDPSPPSNVRDL